MWTLLCYLPLSRGQSKYRIFLILFQFDPLTWCNFFKSHKRQTGKFLQSIRECLLLAEPSGPHVLTQLQHIADRFHSLSGQIPQLISQAPYRYNFRLLHPQAEMSIDEVKAFSRSKKSKGKEPCNDSDSEDSPRRLSKKSGGCSSKKSRKST